MLLEVLHLLRVAVRDRLTPLLPLPLVKLAAAAVAGCASL
jgi:hypothetical protein